MRRAGYLSTCARGGDGYPGVVTAERARTLEVALDFLEPGHRHTVRLHRDGDEAD